MGGSALALLTAGCATSAARRVGAAGRANRQKGGNSRLEAEFFDGLPVEDLADVQETGELSAGSAPDNNGDTRQPQSNDTFPTCSH